MNKEEIINQFENTVYVSFKDSDRMRLEYKERVQENVDEDGLCAFHHPGSGNIYLCNITPYIDDYKDRFKLSKNDAELSYTTKVLCHEAIHRVLFQHIDLDDAIELQESNNIDKCSKLAYWKYDILLGGSKHKNGFGVASNSCMYDRNDGLY